jgi:outer membrane protein assembly factor BamB
MSNAGFRHVVLLGLLFVGCSKNEREVSLALPPLAEIPVTTPGFVREGDAWMSIPARGADGTIFGVLKTSAGIELVRVDEATGRELWRKTVPGLFADYRHVYRGNGSESQRWNTDEVFPEVPVALEGGPHYLVTWGRQFALLERTTGALAAMATFPDAVPAVSPRTAACFVDGKFWIGVDDGGRDGGAWLDPASKTLQTTWAPRPAACPSATYNKSDPAESDLFAMSPLQNAHDSSSKYPSEMCGRYNRSTRSYGVIVYCSDKRTDSGPERDVMFKHADLALFDGKTWLVAKETGPRPFKVSLELAHDQVFLNQVGVEDIEVKAAAGSFEKDRVDTLKSELVTAVGRDGTLRWTRALRKEYSREPAGGRDLLQAWRSVLFASHPSSPVHNVYAFKPGVIVALDQATGEARWQRGKLPALTVH